jgi:hypothetical protein
MPSLVLCYAPEDSALADRLGRYLETNLGYRISRGECLVRPGFDLVDAVERALSAEAALVLLSPHSVPAAWSRDKWEPVFFQKATEFGTLVGFVLLEECRFPGLIRRHRYFDATTDFAGEARTIRRWLLRPELPLRRDVALDESSTELRVRLGEQPGFAQDVDHAAATAFTSACGEDFEGIHRVDCLARSRAGILGDIGRLLQVRLAGTVAQNREALLQQCREHRYLFLLDNTRPEDRDFLSFGGLASAIFTKNAPRREPAPLEAIGAAFLAAPRDEALCAEHMGDAMLCTASLVASDFEAGLRLGWAVVAALKEAGRFAEAVETLELMEAAARHREDTLALYRIGWEQSWLRETSPDHETLCILPTAGPEVTQLSLFA